jgi:hypothetical protein
MPCRCSCTGLHLVEDEQCIVGVAQRLHRLEELGAHMVVAALALDRLGDEARDVVRVALECLPRLGQGRALGSLDASAVRLERKRDGRHVDARPVEGREPVGLAGSVLVSDIV